MDRVALRTEIADVVGEFAFTVQLPFQRINPALRALRSMRNWSRRFRQHSGRGRRAERSVSDPRKRRWSESCRKPGPGRPECSGKLQRPASPRVVARTVAPVQCPVDLLISCTMDPLPNESMADKARPVAALPFSMRSAVRCFVLRQQIPVRQSGAGTL